MALISTQNPWAFVFGLLGNIISFVVFLAPAPTFYRICKKKSTEGFQSLPYITALFSATLWIFYALQKDGSGFLLITINAFGCFIETIYIALYIAFASKRVRVFTVRLFLLMNLGGFCAILFLSHLLKEGPTRVKVLGGICVGFSIIVFAAPLSIIRVVVRTKSVEFMPFYLSFFLTISAVTWLLYGISIKDFYVAFPNILGTVLGALQMILYVVYKYYKAGPVKEAGAKEIAKTVPDHSIDIMKLTTIVPAPDSDPTAQQQQQGAAAATARPQQPNGEDDRTAEIEGVKAVDIAREKSVEPSDPSPV